MRLALVADYDTTDPQRESGIGYHLGTALQRGGVQVDRVTLRAGRRDLLASAARKGRHRISGRVYMGRVRPARLTRNARGLARHLAASPADVLLSPTTWALSHADRPEPAAVWSDTTARGLIGFYPQYSRLAPETVRDWTGAERRFLERAALVVFSSDWAADVARRAYDVDPAKLHVVPFGANLDAVPDAAAARALVAQRRSDSCELVFIGSDWERKGGAHAVQVVRELRRLGVRSRLTVIGPAPAIDAEPGAVRQLGYVPKATAEGRERFAAALRGAHFLVLPTRVDCCPVAIAESNAFAIPAVTTDIAGIPTVVQRDVNGTTFPVDASPAEWAQYIAERWTGDYERLAFSARARYDERLNWASAAAQVIGLLATLAPGQATGQGWT